MMEAGSPRVSLSDDGDVPETPLGPLDEENGGRNLLTGRGENRMTAGAIEWPVMLRAVITTRSTG